MRGGDDYCPVAKSVQVLGDRWCLLLVRERLRGVDRFNELKRQAEEDEMTERSTYVYVIYIQSTAERVWQALTDADLTARFWGTAMSPTGSRARLGSTGAPTARTSPTSSARWSRLSHPHAW
jgi:hypothetical protein